MGVGDASRRTECRGRGIAGAELMLVITSYSRPHTDGTVTDCMLLPIDPDRHSRCAPGTRASDILRLSTGMCNGIAPGMACIGARVAAGYRVTGAQHRLRSCPGGTELKGDITGLYGTQPWSGWSVPNRGTPCADAPWPLLCPQLRQVLVQCQRFRIGQRVAIEHRLAVDDVGDRALHLLHVEGVGDVRNRKYLGGDVPGGGVAQ